MRFFLSIILIALLSAAAEQVLPWWSVAAVAFLVSLFVKQGAGRAFLMGFLGVATFWLIAALMRDIANQHILSMRMAVLFKLPNYGLFIALITLIGGLVGGLGAWAGALIKPRW